MMNKPIVQVAIGILLHQSKVLVGWREAKQHQGNKHEFPGGKVELGETPEQACTREVFEEVGIGIQQWHCFDLIKHEYDDIHVHLHLFHATVDAEQLQQIHKPWTWYERSQLKQLNFPKANDAIIARLDWLHLIKVSNQLSHLHVLSSDSLMYLRLSGEASADLILGIENLSAEKLNHLILNIDHWKKLSPTIQKQISAVHFKQDQLMHLSHSDRIVGLRSIAACHDLLSLDRAQQLGFDAVILSPVLHTATHPDAKPLGWEQFEILAKDVNIPVFALGGLKPDALKMAQQHGAFGVAGVSQF